VLGFDNRRKTLSNPHDMDQIRNSVNVRALLRSNALYSSSTVSNKYGV